MGSLSSALAPVLQVGMAMAGDAQARSAAKSNDAAAYDAAKNAAAITRESNRLADLQAETDRRAALKRAVARQRAAYGGAGVDAGDGSAEAVLLGLFAESDTDRVTREKTSRLKDVALNQSLDAKKQINLLQQAQLQQKQALSRITDFF